VNAESPSPEAMLRTDEDGMDIQCRDADGIGGGGSEG